MDVTTSLTRKSLFLAMILAVFSNVAYKPAYAASSVENFARLPTFTDLEIAPGGNFLAARLNNNNTYAVVIFDLSGSGIRVVYGFAENDENSVAWFRWVSPEHLLASIAFTAERGGLRRVQTHESRLVTLDATTQNYTELFRDRRGDIPVQIQDHIVSYLPNDPEHILVQYSREDPSQPHVYKVKVNKRGKHTRIARGRNGVLDWMADAQGEIRLGQGVKADKFSYLTIRTAGNEKWRDFSHRVNQPGVVFNPIAFASDPNKMYVASNHEGDPTGLYIFDISADEFGELTFRHPTVDIAGIDVDETTAELRSINFVEDSVATKYMAIRPIQEDIHRMTAQFPGKHITTTSISGDGDHAVFRVQAANDPGTYYLYDRTAPLIRRLPKQYPDLRDELLGRTFVTNYAARDGLNIPAFITLPPGMDELEASQQSPFVIVPHGGPAARDFLRFDYWVQFLVSRGYGVLQMNFRGSAGYGQAFADAGNREWGQAMQDDITDGVQWLVDNGYANPNGIAIMGGSYGGYAALMGAVKTPDLYQCAISFAGVSDLPDLIRLQRKYIGGRYATRFVGDLWNDRKMLVANSPARRAEEISIPILLVHGDSDVVVDIDQSKKNGQRATEAR